MADRGFTVRALGEIAIRCRDLEAMTAFYREGIVFFRIAAGYGGHTCVLALFGPDAGNETLHPRGVPQGDATSSLHHLALTVGRTEQDRAVEWYRKNGIETKIQEFAWIGWRGVFTTDPEGNTVELVAYDADAARTAP